MEASGMNIMRSERVRFAEKDDEIALRSLMMEYGMDIPGEIEEQVIIKEGQQILAGGKIIEHETNIFFLEVLGVDEGSKGQGYGGQIIEEMKKDPWGCCQSPVSSPFNSGEYEVSTVARGEAKDFYQKHGFMPCDFSQIPEPYQEQCAECPDQAQCKPVPMIYKWRISE